MTGLAQPAMSEGENSDWTERIQINGDMRLRYEAIDEEGEDSLERGRFRLRLGMTVDATDAVQVVMQIATGEDDPVSANQSFADGFSISDLGLDLAYLDWKATDNLHVYGGKMKNPLFRAGETQVIWDGDLHPEGLAATYNSGMFFGTAGAFSVEQRSSTSDSMLFAAQAGLRFGIGENSSLTAGVGYFGYTNTIGNEPFYLGHPKGNSVDVDGHYIYAYRDTEVFAQFDTRIGARPFQVYAHAVQNNEVVVADTAYTAGARIGSARTRGSMEYGWEYLHIEADAIVGTFNDSDFAGGNTDSSGHLITVKYAWSENIALGGTFFINSVDRGRGVEHDYDRMNLDIELSF